jgi:hypothetical protein
MAGGFRALTGSNPDDPHVRSATRIAVGMVGWLAAYLVPLALLLVVWLLLRPV